MFLQVSGSEVSFACPFYFPCGHVPRLAGWMVTTAWCRILAPAVSTRPAIARRALGGHSVSNEPLLLCATGSPSQQRLPDAEPAADLSLVARLSTLDPSRFLYGGKTPLELWCFHPRRARK